MKRLLSIILTLFMVTGFVFAADDTEGDEYDDDYVYEINGSGDQFLKFNIGTIIPTSFGGTIKNGGSLYTGGELELGYYRFMNKWLAVGGEIEISYNLSIGNKILVMIPFTFGAMMQPSVGNFEFPIFLTAGFGYETWENYNYFPSLSAKASAGAYYRLNESFSFGVTGSFLYIPQWGAADEATKHRKLKNGCFVNATAALRYHF